MVFAIYCTLELTYSIDVRLVANDKRPIFVVTGAMVKDGGTIQYYGLGYKVIGWKRLTAKQNRDNKVTGRMVGYEISTIFNPHDINEGPKKELKFVTNK